MRRLLFSTFLVACGGGSAQPVARAQTPAATTTATATAPAMQVARPHEAHFTGVAFVAYGAMLQPGDRPHFTDEGPAPHGAVALADVQCRAEDVVGSPFKVTCANGKPSTITDANEKAFRDRLTACFQTNVVALPPNVLRAIEASIPKGTSPVMLGKRPDVATPPFIAVGIESHVVGKAPLVPIFDDPCANVPHPCDAVGRKIIGYQPQDPNAKNLESRAHSFVGFGPNGYAAYPTEGLPPIFGGVTVATIYAAPMLDGDRPDPRFVVQRYAYPKFSWEPPPAVSAEAVKETYARITALDPDRENDATQLAIFLDRAVLAYSMRDGVAAKRHVHDLDAWLARHPNALPDYDYAKQALENLHLLERGKLSITDPCSGG